jgi:hypothetical protein
MAASAPCCACWRPTRLPDPSRACAMRKQVTFSHLTGCGSPGSFLAIGRRMSVYGAGLVPGDSPPHVRALSADAVNPSMEALRKRPCSRSRGKSPHARRPADHPDRNAEPGRAREQPLRASLTCAESTRLSLRLAMTLRGDGTHRDSPLKWRAGCPQRPRVSWAGCRLRPSGQGAITMRGGARRMRCPRALDLLAQRRKSGIR